MYHHPSPPYSSIFSAYSSPSAIKWLFNRSKIRIRTYIVVSSSFDAESEHSHEAGDENDRIEYFGHFGEFEGKTSRTGTRRVAWFDWGMTVLLYW